MFSVIILISLIKKTQKIKGDSHHVTEKVETKLDIF